MRTFIKDLVLALLMGAVLPGVLLRTVTPEQSVAAEETAVIWETTMCTEPMASCMILFRQPDGTAVEIELEQYLVGVVLGEMPAYFEEEALKAQTVVARTYTLKAHITGGKHGDSSICGNSQCCQAYLSVMDYLERGGTGESVEKVRSAVAATAGKVLTYEGGLIEATYFSCSGGITEDAQAVWGTEYPYLKSVPSPGEEDASVFTDTVSFSADQFQKQLGMNLMGNPELWFGEMTYTAGNGVATMDIGGKKYTGTQLRSLLGLRSTIFEVEVTADSILFHTKGFGHRVGMSQHGADAMAVNGSTYDQILAYYYQGTTLAEMAAFL